MSEPLFIDRYVITVPDKYKDMVELRGSSIWGADGFEAEKIVHCSECKFHDCTVLPDGARYDFCYKFSSFMRKIRNIDEFYCCGGEAKESE